MTTREIDAFVIRRLFDKGIYKAKLIVNVDGEGREVSAVEKDAKGIDAVPLSRADWAVTREEALERAKKRFDQRMAGLDAQKAAVLERMRSARLMVP